MQEPYQNKDGALCDKITWFAFEKKQKSLTGTRVTQKSESLKGNYVILKMRYRASTARSSH